MNTHYTSPTLDLIRELSQQGISRMALAIRHSARHYSDDVKMEPFMSLTEKGRHMALALGEALPEHVELHFFSSYIGRCIETAYLIDKGFVGKTGGLTRNNQVVDDVSPFYVRDIRKTVKILLEEGVDAFIRNWMDGAFDEAMIMNAEEASMHMLRFLAGSLVESNHHSLQISVTHDWNIYLLKEYGLGLPHETFGKIDYMEGVVVFEKNGKVYIANHQKDPFPLRLT